MYQVYTDLASCLLQIFLLVIIAISCHIVHVQSSSQSLTSISSSLHNSPVWYLGHAHHPCMHSLMANRAVRHSGDYIQGQSSINSSLSGTPWAEVTGGPRGSGQPCRSGQCSSYSPVLDNSQLATHQPLACSGPKHGLHGPHQSYAPLCMVACRTVMHAWLIGHDEPWMMSC